MRPLINATVLIAGIGMITGLLLLASGLALFAFIRSIAP
ncbi:hypothetical protein BJ970_006179 [Saccharopolyspora phatthalungensis]|uniref:Uncharacterized protein n=1 Tax=Saccharopolyspora phatthalungensis TaxID=664693 RepID=A0A840QF98_9PSEU|nr:hypothetical protein [Saccharopolyspora phatthalungensis]